MPTAKFEPLNPSVSINVVSYEDREVFQLHTSKYTDRKHHVSLLFIVDAKGDFHYSLVRSFGSSCWTYEAR